MHAELKKVKAVFLEAGENVNPDQWGRYLDGACCEDAELRSDVEVLLKAHSAGDCLFDKSVFTSAVTTDHSITEGLGTIIDRYKLLELIGEGGFGDVYMAEQQEPVRRKVALKVIKLGMDTRQVIARFEAERQALALMDHPNIAKVLDAGATEAGRPYFVMELVRGLQIIEFCNANKLTTKDRLNLFVDVCHAVQHAHQKGIIHRDLKPTNVLVTQQDTQPVPKIIDFGIAKATQQRLTEKTLFTEHHQLIGTPEYMSPEQATFGESDVDTRTDVYSLGVLLYELLVGTTPFAAEQLRIRGYDKICQVIRERDPLTPSRQLSTLGADLTDVCQQRQVEPTALQKLLHGDLNWIVMKCLAKERTQRYETVEALAIDIGRHLHYEPIEARASSPFDRLQKFTRKHTIQVAAAVAVLVAICVGLAVSSAGFLVAVKQRDRANELLYVSDMNTAYQAWNHGNLQRVQELLARHGEARAGVKEPRGFEWHYLRSQYQNLSSTPTLTHGDPVRSVAFSPDGTMLASGGIKGVIKLWDLTTQELRWTLVGHTAQADLIAFAPDGKILASGSHDTLVSGSFDHSVRLWDLEIGESLAIFKIDGPAQCFSFSPDGKTVTTVTKRGQIYQWNVETGQPVDKLPPLKDLKTFRVASFSPDGKTVVTGYGDGPMEIWDVATGTRQATLPGHEYLVYTIAFSADGKLLASGGTDDTVMLWNVSDPKRPREVQQLTARRNLVRQLAFSPDGRLLAGAGWDKTVKLWDVHSGTLLATLRGHAQFNYCVAFSTDGSTLASGSLDGTVKLWQLDEINQRLIPEQRIGFEQTSLAFSPDGKMLALACGNDRYTIHESRYGQVTLWNVDTGKLQQVLMETDTPTTAVAFSPDGKTLAVGTDAWDSTEDLESGEIQMVDLASGTVAFTLIGHENRVTSVAFSPDGSKLASASRDRTVRLWQVSSGKQLYQFPSGGMAVAFSPNGKTLVSSYGNNRENYGYVYFWDVATGREIKQLNRYTARMNSVLFSPDGNLLASGSGDSTVRLLDAKTFHEDILHGHAMMVYGVAFSQDGKTLASCGRVGAVKLWNLATGQELATLKTRLWMTNIAFSPDGKTLAAACQDKTITLWRTQTDKSGNSLLGSTLLRAPRPNHQKISRQ